MQLAMFVIALSAIMELCVSVFVGIFTGKSIPFARTTLRDFGFLTSNVLLPCLALSSTAQSITWQIVLRCAILLLFMTIQMTVGYGCAVLMTRCLFPLKPHHTGLSTSFGKDVRLELMYEKKSVTRQAVRETTVSSATTDKEENAEKCANTNSHDGQAMPTNSNSKNDNSNNDTTTTSTSTSTSTTFVHKPFIAVIVKDSMCTMDMMTEREILPLLDIPSIQYDHYPAYLWMSILACTIPNTISVPLALLQNLTASLTFLNFNFGVTYTMLFNTLCTIYLWGAAPFMLRKAQKEVEEQRELRKLMMELKFLHNKMDAFVQTSNNGSAISSRLSPLESQLSTQTNELNDTSTTTSKNHDNITTTAATTITTKTPTSDSNSMECKRNDMSDVNNNNIKNNISSNTTAGSAECGEHSYEWEQLNLIRIFRESEYNEMQKRTRNNTCEALEREEPPATVHRRFRHLHQYRRYKWIANRRLWKRMAKQTLYLPFLATVIGAVVGLTPPLKGLFFDGGVLEMIMDATALVAQGAIPAILVLLGANLGGSLTTTTNSSSNNNNNNVILSSETSEQGNQLRSYNNNNNNSGTALSRPSEATLLATVVMENYGQNVNFTFDAADLTLLAGEGDLDLNAAAAALDRRAAEEAAKQKAEAAERREANKLKRAAKRKQARIAAAAAAAKSLHENDNNLSCVDKSVSTGNEDNSYTSVSKGNDDKCHNSSKKDYYKEKINKTDDNDDDDYDDDDDDEEYEEEEEEEMRLNVDMHASFALHPIVELAGVYDNITKKGKVTEEGQEMHTWQEHAEQVDYKVSHGKSCTKKDCYIGNDDTSNKEEAEREEEGEGRLPETENSNAATEKSDSSNKAHGKTLMTNTQYIMFASPSSESSSPSALKQTHASQTREQNEENERERITFTEENATSREKRMQERHAEQSSESNRGKEQNVTITAKNTLSRHAPQEQATSVEIIVPEQSEQPTTYWAAICAAFSLTNVSKRFVWGIIFVRLILIPALNLLILFGVVKLFPSFFLRGEKYGRTVVVALILQLSAPTAISSLVLFQAQEFMVYTWAKMLFIQYILCILSSWFWLGMGLQILAATT